MAATASGLAVILLMARPTWAQNPTPVGVWQDDSRRVQVEIAPCGERLCGKLVWFRWPNDAAGLPLVDLKNSNPALRSRPLLGLTILEGLRRTDAQNWAEGRLYNPDDGVNYRARMILLGDDTLKMRAYVLLPILGKTSIWTRVRQPRALSLARAYPALLRIHSPFEGPPVRFQMERPEPFS